MHSQYQENRCLCPWTSTVPEHRAVLQLTMRTSTFRGSPQPRPLGKMKTLPLQLLWCSLQHACCCDGGWLDMAGRHSHWCRKTYETTSSNVLSLFTIWKLEFWLFLFFSPSPQGCYMDKISCAVCVVHLQWKYRGLNSTSCYGSLSSWCQSKTLRQKK